MSEGWAKETAPGRRPSSPGCLEWQPKRNKKGGFPGHGVPLRVFATQPHQIIRYVLQAHVFLGLRVCTLVEVQADFKQCLIHVSSSFLVCYSHYGNYFLVLMTSMTSGTSP